MRAEVTRWKREFAKSAEFRREQELFAKEVERRLKQDRDADRTEDSLDDLTTMAVLATDADIAEFQLKLDAYDAATVEALMENERLREIAQAKIEELLGDAYVLGDGRRVFKSKDGRVFDEFGVELGADEIDPELIEDWRPGYEDYVLVLTEKQELEQERTDLLEFQDRIDEAREQIEEDDLTKQDIEAIGDDLEASMPMVVRKQTSDFEETSIANVRSDFADAASPERIVVPDLKNDLQQLGQ